MKTLNINDLEISKDLDDASMKSVTGGMFGLGQVAGQQSPLDVAGGGIFSPTVVTSVPVNTQVGVVVDLDTALDLENSVANVIASAYSGIGQ
jgi:hypothetical protein